MEPDLLDQPGLQKLVASLGCEVAWPAPAVVPGKCSWAGHYGEVPVRVIKWSGMFGWTADVYVDDKAGSPLFNMRWDQERGWQLTNSHVGQWALRKEE